MQLDLANMNARDLRRALDSARDRGQAQQSYAILQEMARRRMEEPRPKPRFSRARRRAEPNLITLDLGDPLAPKDDAWDLPEAPPSEDAPAPEIERPLTLERPPEPPPRREPSPPPPALPRRRKAPIGVFAAGAVLGVALGAAGGFVGAIASAPAPAPAALQTAQVEAAPLPVGALAPPPSPLAAEPAPPPAPAVDPAAVAAPPQGLQLAVVSPDAMDVSQAAEDAAAQPEPKPEFKAEPKPDARADAQVLKASAEPCTAATPADRAICRDPALQRLQKALREAYAEALSAHADRATLRQRQLAWRDARSEVADPVRLAALYESRIRKLEAATADARRQP